MNQNLRTVLEEWGGRKIPEVIGRDVFLDILPKPVSNMATVVTGFRRVGKTYLLFEAIHKLLQTSSRREVVYINFEDERLNPPRIDFLTDLIPEVEAIFGQKPRYLFLDELQLIPNWSKWVRRILDTEQIQIFITGSSSKMSSSELPTELRGRAWEVKVSPLNFGEFLRFKNEPKNSSRFRFLFDEYLNFGALPAVTLSSPEKKQELLQTYFQTVVQREISERYKIDNDLALKTLLKLLLNSNLITVSKLTNSLKSLGVPVGKTTIDNYISYIESSYFMNEMYIYKAGTLNQLQYPRKIYFVDNGFIMALSTKFSKHKGRLFENLVYQRLSFENEGLYYYRDDRQLEVDFAVLKDEGNTSLFQVCYDLSEEETLNREVRALLKAGKELSSKDLNIITIEAPVGLNLPDEIKVLTAKEFFG